MSKQRAILWCVVGVFVLGLLIQPAVIHSQCNVINTMSYLTSAPATVFITKTLSAPANCHTTAMNASSCFPGATIFSTNMLYAIAMSFTMSPSCAWSCTCGTGAPPHVVIDSNDGLPVELMEFSIEGPGETADGDGENPNDDA